MTDVAMDYVAVTQRTHAHLFKPVSDRVLSDYQPWFDSLADDVLLEYASPEGRGEFRGKEAVIDYISGLFSSLSGDEVIEDVQLERDPEYVTKGERVVMLWRENTRNKQTGATTPGKEVVLVMDYGDGKLQRIRRFSQ
ncbi:MAG: hypothetical protein V7607_5671 [Solirubrobacteraceae bacterium]